MNKNKLKSMCQNHLNRYVKLRYMKPTNNVRDFYLHALRIGGQAEDLGLKTYTSDIGLALYQGGKLLENTVQNG